MRYWWSLVRHLKSKKYSDCRPDLYPEDMFDIRELSQLLYKNFSYRRDGVLNLFDSLNSPAQLWEDILKKPPLVDDCDGFHGALYWAVHHNFDCALMTLVTKDLGQSHTCLYVENGGLHYYVEYDYVSIPHTQMGLLIEDIRKHRDMPEITIVEYSTWSGRMWTKHDIQT